MNYELINIFCDGGARGNPGEAAIGVVIKNQDNRIIYSFGKKIGETTNNAAEYAAVIEALGYLVKQVIRAEKIIFHSDSLLVCRQLEGKFKIKQEHLQKLFDQAKDLEQKVGESVSFVHIPREQNKQADRLVNEALDAKLR